jgi:hypothetical protein
MSVSIDERDRVSALIRVHFWDFEEQACACISHGTAMGEDIPRMSILEHSWHIAELILGELGHTFCLRCKQAVEVDADSGWCQECLNGPLPANPAG